MLKVLVGAAAVAVIATCGIFATKAYNETKATEGANQHARVVRGCITAESSGKAPTLTKFCRDNGYLVASR